MNYNLLVQRQVYPRDYSHINPEREPELARVFSHMLKVRLGWDDLESRHAYVEACRGNDREPILVWLAAPEMITWCHPRRWREEVIDFLLNGNVGPNRNHVISYILSDGFLHLKSLAFWKQVWFMIVGPILNQLSERVVSDLFVNTNNDWFAQQILSHIDLVEKLEWAKIVGSGVAFRHFISCFEENDIAFMAIRGHSQSVIAAAYEAGGRCIHVVGRFPNAPICFVGYEAVVYYLSHPDRYKEIGFTVVDWITYHAGHEGDILGPLKIVKLMRRFQIEMPESFYTLIVNGAGRKCYLFALAFLSHGYNFPAPIPNRNIPEQENYLLWHPEWTHHYYSEAFKSRVEAMLLIFNRTAMDKNIRNWLLMKIFH